MNKLIPTLLFALVVGSQLGATDCGQIITDPGFDLWCGNQMCFWKVDEGAAHKVPTWIAGDDGVSLDGDKAAISQMTAVTSDDTNCIEFDLTANVDESADVELQADVFGDGTIDWTERIPSSNWEKLSFKVGLQGSYQGIKFRITKQGAGNAVLADISAQTSTGCPDFKPVLPHPDGAACSTVADCTRDSTGNITCPDPASLCASGICDSGVCGACTPGTTCSNGDLCGASGPHPGWLSESFACVAPASRLIGERCYTGAECASGICDGTICEECDNANLCADGSACAASPNTTIRECGGGAHDRAAGADCVADADCTSGHCAGTPFGYCPDGEPCAADLECGLNGDLTPIACTVVAVSGGTCQ